VILDRYQTEAVRRILGLGTAALRGEKPTPRVLVLSGVAGTGKTHVFSQVYPRLVALAGEIDEATVEEQRAERAGVWEARRAEYADLGLDMDDDPDLAFASAEADVEPDMGTKKAKPKTKLDEAAEVMAEFDICFSEDL